MEDLPHQQNDNNMPERRDEDAAFDAFYELGEKLRTPEVQEIIDQLIAMHDPDEVYDPGDVLLKHGKNILPGEYYAFLEMHAKLRKMFDAQDEPNDMPTSEMDAPDKELMTYIVDEARRLLYASSGTRLWQGGYTEDEKEAISEAREDLQRIIRDSNMSVESLHAYYDLLERSRAALLATYILDSRVERPSSAYNIDELHRAHELNERYRPGHVQLYPEAATNKLLLPTHYWQVEMINETRTHLEEYLRSLDSSSEIARLDIEGLELLPFSLDTNEIRNFLQDLPGITFEGVTGIYFQERPPEDRHIKTDEVNGRWAILAEHQHNFESNDSQITIRADAISNYFEKRYNAALTPDGVSNDGKLVAHYSARAETIEFIKDTLVHEFGHAFLYRIPVAFLNDWDVAVFESVTDQPVSRYVEMTDTLDLGSYPIEDFAESFALSLLHPDRLRERAPDRAAAMQALINSCRP